MSHRPTDVDWFAAFDLLRAAGQPCDARAAYVAKWIRCGRLSGYPECCIRHFVLARLGVEGWQTAEIHPVDGRRLCARCVIELDRRWPNRHAVKAGGCEPGLRFSVRARTCRRLPVLPPPHSLPSPCRT